MWPMWSANTSIFTPQLVSISAPSPRVGFGLHSLASEAYTFHILSKKQTNMHSSSFIDSINFIHNGNPDQTIPLNTNIHRHSMATTRPAAAASLASRSAKSSCTSLAKVPQGNVGTRITIHWIHWWAFLISNHDANPVDLHHLHH